MADALVMFLDKLAPMLKYAGILSAIGFSTAGSAYGTKKSAEGVSAVSIAHPELVMRSFIPVIQAGVIGIYGLVLSVVILRKDTPSDYVFADGCADLAAGLACGLACLYSGRAIGDIGLKGLMGLKDHADKQCVPSRIQVPAQDEAQQALLSEVSHVSNPNNVLSWWAKPFVSMVMSLIYAEALGLYGLIVGLLIACCN